MRVELGYLGFPRELGWLRRPAKYQLGRVLSNWFCHGRKDRQTCDRCSGIDMSGEDA